MQNRVGKLKEIANKAIEDICGAVEFENNQHLHQIDNLKKEVIKLKEEIELLKKEKENAAP